MTILVLNRGKLALRPYHDWLAAHPEPLLLLAAGADLARFGEQLPATGGRYAHAEAIADWDDDDVVVTRAMELAVRHRISHVVACQERDLERAGEIRDRLGLPGQSRASARAFRDKLLMKQICARAGIEVAPHDVAAGPDELRRFVAAYGLPVVVKPRSGFSSVGLHILRDGGQLDRFLAAWRPQTAPRTRDDLLVEAFVEGSMYHVDGMVYDGSVAVAWPSKYHYQLASFADSRSPRFDTALDPNDPLTTRLLDFADAVLAALPTPLNTTFHAEVFHTPDDRLVLCEIASRNGGALIKSVLDAMYGVDLPTLWVQADCGLPVPLPRDGSRLTPARVAGQALLLKRPGVVRAIGGPPRLPWLHRFERYVEPGSESTGAQSSGDFMAAMVAHAPDAVTCRSRLEEAARRFEQELVIEPAAGVMASGARA